MTTYVLVHGGWHGGWCWRKVAPLLRAAGHDVHTPTLTALGDRSHLASPDVGLATHVQDVVALLDCEDLSGVVLVGHSGAGPVVTGVAAAMPARVARLVYLDAFVPEPGQAVLDLLPAARRGFFAERAREQGGGWLVPLDWEVAMDGWGVTDPTDRDWMRPRLAAQPLTTLDQPLPAPAPSHIPCSYVHCLDNPVAATFAPFAERARDDPGRWTLRRLHAGHDAMVTVPGPLTDLLLGEAPGDR